MGHVLTTIKPLNWKMSCKKFINDALCTNVRGIMFLCLVEIAFCTLQFCKQKLKLCIITISEQRQHKYNKDREIVYTCLYNKIKYLGRPLNCP